MSDWQRVVRGLYEQGVELTENRAPADGGGINATWRAESRAGPVFLKTCPAADGGRLIAEAEGSG